MDICCLSPVSPLVLFHHIHFFTYQGIFLAEGFFCPRGGGGWQRGFVPRFFLSKVGYVLGGVVQGGLCPRGVLSKVVYVLGGFWRGGFGRGVLESFFWKGGFWKGGICPATIHRHAHTSTTYVYILYIVLTFPTHSGQEVFGDAMFGDT